MLNQLLMAVIASWNLNRIFSYRLVHLVWDNEWLTLRKEEVFLSFVFLWSVNKNDARGSTRCNLEKCDQNKQSKFEVHTNLPLFVKSLHTKPNHVLHAYLFQYMHFRVIPYNWNNIKCWVYIQSNFDFHTNEAQQTRTISVANKKKTFLCVKNWNRFKSILAV